MPPLLWLEIVCLAISIVIASALAMMVLGFRSKHATTRWFIHFTSVEAIWAVSSLLLRLALWFDIGNTSMLLELGALCFVLMSPFLLMFTVRYLDLATRWVDQATVAGLTIIALSTPALFRHQLLLAPHLGDNGLVFYTINNLGYVIASLPILYLGWALLLFWQERRRVKEPYLALSVLALLIGFGVGALLIASLPIRPILNTLSLIILGYGVVSRQLFNPLRELSEELEQRVEKRTQELAQAGAQLSAIHALGQKLVLSRNAVEIAQWVVDAAQKVLNISICGLWIVDEEQKTLTLWARTNGADIQKTPPTPLDSEQGIIVSVVRSGESLYLPDVSQDPRYVGGKFLARSELCVPLRVSGQVIGALNAESEHLDGFSLADRQLLEALSNSAAITIHNARLYEETRKRAERLAVVNNIASVAGVAFHPDDLMEMVYLEIVPAFHPDIFSITLYDEQTEELDFCYEVDGSVRRLPAKKPLGIGLPSIIVADKEPLLIRDLEQEKDHLPPQTTLTETEKDAISWLGVPMLLNERVIGVISVQAYRRNAWGADDELLLSTVADQAAGALEKARLFQERERRVIELAIVNEIGQAVSSTTEMDTLLETVHHQVSRLFDTTNFYIATHVEGSGEWVLAFAVEQGEHQPITHHPVKAGLTGHIIRTRQPFLSRSSDEITAFHKTHEIDSIGLTPISWLGVPLITADEVVGVMTIQNYERENLYDEQDQALFSTIAAQVATAMGNLRLLEKARRRAQDMEAINEVGGAITSMLDLDAVLHQITDITKARFGHYSVGIALLEGDQLVFRSGSTVGESGVRFAYEQLSVSLTHKVSLVAKAGRTGRPILADDTNADPLYMPTSELPDTRCELSLPIKAKGRVIGVLDVQSDRPFAYDQTDVALLQSLADQAGVAIQNARLYEEIEQQLGEQTILFNASQSLANAPLRAEEITEVAAIQLVKVMQITNCSFSQITPQGDTIQILADLWIEDGTEQWHETGELFALSDYPATARVMETLEPLVVQADDPDADPAELAYMKEYETATLAMFPLASKGQAIGVMELESLEKRHYTPSQLNMATTLANQVAAALENARLYKESQQRLREQTMLFDASQSLATAPLQAEEILRVAARQLAEALGNAECSFSLLNSQTGVLRVMANLEVRDGITHWYELSESFTLSEYPATARVMETLEPLVVQANDPDADPAELAYMKKNETATLAIFPLAVKGQAIGVMELETEQAQDYTPERLNMGMTLTNQVSVTLEHARLYEAMQLELIERERAEEALRESEEQYRLLFNSGSDFIFVHPLIAKDGISKFIEVNDVACQKLGYSKQELLNLGPTDIGVQTESADTLYPTKELLATGHAIFEQVLVTKDGVRIPVENSARVFDLRGHPTILTISRDITERKQAEEQLRRYSAELEQSNAEVKRFAYVVSHDLRAPLVNLKGFASELRIALDEIQPVIDTVMPHLDDGQRQTLNYALQEDAPEALEFINSSVTRMDRFISSLLKLSRYGRRELKLESVDMESLVQAILQTLAHQLAERQVKTSIGPLPHVIADRTSIEQIMGNILDNGVKYLEHDRPGKLEITAERSDGEIIFHIQDNGCGIAESDMDKVFTPFRRAGKQNVPGEGIGLAYVQALVRRHGGRIWCESELGVGTLISFALPDQ